MTRKAFILVLLLITGIPLYSQPVYSGKPKALGQVKQVIIFDTIACKVFFDNDSSNLKATESRRIDSYLKKTDTLKLVKILLAAHTDTNAAARYNQGLSEKRAATVKNYLVSRKVNPALVAVAAFGETRFLKNESNERNRRVEILFIHKREIQVTTLNGDLYLAVYVKDSVSRLALEAALSLEEQVAAGSNSFAKADKKGYFLFRISSANPHKLFVQMDGYLSRAVVIDPAELSSDTTRVDVLLEKVVVAQKMVFENIYFYSNEDRFMPNSYVALSKLFESLKNNPGSYIEIQGHVNYSFLYPAPNDSVRYFLQDLSFRRAKKVYEYLVLRGIAPERMTYRGFSNTRMVKPYASTEAEMVKNRRVEVLLLKKTQ